jgi:hypothetical protein
MTLDFERLRAVCDSIKGQNPEDANPTTHAFYLAGSRGREDRILQGADESYPLQNNQKL